MKFNDIKKVYDGKFLNYYKANFTTELGNEKIYELVSRNKDLTKENYGINPKTNAAAMIIFNEDESKVLMLKEFRMACNRVVFNIPAGLIDEGENVFEAAKRELMEETGLELYEIQDVLSPAYTAVGFCDELVSTIVGKARGSIKNSTSDVEEIETIWLTKKEAQETLKNNQYMSLRAQTLLYMWSRK